MKRIKQLCAVVTLAAFCQFAGAVPHAFADDDNAVASDQAVELAKHKEREAFAHEFAQTVISVLHDPKKSYGDRKNLLRQSFSDSVDIDWIARFVIGPTWRSATDEQKARYVKLYRKYLTETYITNFAENPESGIYDIKVSSVTDAEDNHFVVHTQMQLMNQDNLKVDYRVHEEDGHYKVRDIAIENVSLIVTHRSEFTSLASEEGIDGVSHRLEQLLTQTKPEMISMK